MYNFSMLLEDNMHKSFEEKIKVFNKLLINNIEINDSIENKNITELNGEEIERIRNLLVEYNKKIVLLNCSKNINDYEYYKAVFKIAYILGIENVKLGFNLNLSNKCNAIKEYLELILKLGDNYGIGTLIENNCSIGSTHDVEVTKFCIQCGIDKSSLGLIFNPLEYVKLKKHPFFHVFYNSKLKNNIQFLRITDGLFKDGSSTLPGQGNGEMKEMASALLARSFKGYFSFTPYLKDVDEYTIVSKFKAILMEI